MYLQLEERQTEIQAMAEHTKQGEADELDYLENSHHEGRGLQQGGYKESSSILTMKHAQKDSSQRCPVLDNRSIMPVCTNDDRGTQFVCTNEDRGLRPVCTAQGDNHNIPNPQQEHEDVSTGNLREFVSSTPHHHLNSQVEDVFCGQFPGIVSPTQELPEPWAILHCQQIKHQKSAHPQCELQEAEVNNDLVQLVNGLQHHPGVNSGELQAVGQLQFVEENPVKVEIIFKTKTQMVVTNSLVMVYSKTDQEKDKDKLDKKDGKDVTDDNA